MTPFRRIFKTIFKYRIASLMTIGSLIISFSGMIILVLYVSFEKSYDRLNKNYQSVYRIETQQYGSHIPAVMGVEIKNDIPEIESLTTVFFAQGACFNTWIIRFQYQLSFGDVVL